MEKASSVSEKIEKTKQFEHQFDLSDDKCILAGMDIGMIGSEDVVLGKYGILFIASGDLKQTFENGPRAANPGGIFMMNMNKTEDLKKLEIVEANIKSSPISRKSFQLHPHGMDISNSTNRLYAVNHNDGYDSVIIYDINYNLNCLEENAQGRCSFQNTVILEFKDEIKSDLFPFMGLNDVVEASETEFYVSQWLPFGYPKR